MRLGIWAVLIPAAAILLFAAIGIWKRKEGRKHPWHCTLYCRDAEAWCCLITPALCLCVPLLVLILTERAPDALLIPVAMLAMGKLCLVNQKLWWKGGVCFYRTMTGREIRRDFRRIRLVRTLGKGDHSCVLLVIRRRMILLMGVSAEKCHRFVTDYEAWRARNESARVRGKSAGKTISPSCGFGVFLLASIAFLAIGLSCAALAALALSGGCVRGAELFRTVFMDRIFPRVLGAGLVCLGICLIRASVKPEKAEDRHERKERMWQRSTGARTSN